MSDDRSANNELLGIHHVTAIASDPQRNLDFYTRVLGLRLVKRTVNFDDPGSYHFYFGDETGTPGTLLTFFPWPGAPRGRPGPGQVTLASFAVRPASIGFWLDWLIQHGVPHAGPDRRGKGGVERVLSLRDPDGLLLEIVGHDDVEFTSARADAYGIPAEHALRGFRSVTMWVKQQEPTEQTLVETLGLRLVEDEGTTRRYAIANADYARFIDVRAVGEFPTGVQSAGTIHHVALRVPNRAAQLRVRQRVQAAGLEPTPVIDRTYFESVYFREPGGVLFELATDPPGFAVDEQPDHLGERLMLPERYERQRAQIEAVLPPIEPPVSEAAERLA